MIDDSSQPEVSDDLSSTPSEAIEIDPIKTGRLSNWKEVIDTCNLSTDKEMDFISKWLIIVRACVFTMTIFSGLIGGLLALSQGNINWLYWGLCIFGIVIAHAANNMINDYFDLKGGVDDSEYARAMYAPHPILAGLISKKGLIAAILLFNAIDGLIMIFFIWARGWEVLFFALAGLFISVFYVAPPFNLKRRGLGEPAVAIIWGPLMTCGTYFVVSGELPMWVWFASLPYALTVMAVLFGKHIDKYDQDKAKGITTFPVLIGEKASRMTNIFLLITFYIVIVGIVAFKALGMAILLTFLAIPRLITVIKVYLKPKPEEPPEEWPIWPLWFVGWAFHFIKLAGSMLVLGLVINLLLPEDWQWFW